MNDSNNRKPPKTRKKTAPARVGKPKSVLSSNQSPFPVVGIGASAGGLQALEQFFSHTATDTGMAFVVVVHLDPTHKTVLPELLARYTRMEVCSCEEGMPAEPNKVFVIPENRDLTITDSLFHLEEPHAPRGIRHPIDIFLNSLAADQQENAIAVILSGTGTDGTLGIKAVKDAGGMVAVQDETSAKHPGMPQSAVATGLADLILPAEELPVQIQQAYRQTASLTPLSDEGRKQQIHDQLRLIFQIVKSRTGHDFSSYKVSTIMRRIERRMAMNDIINFRDYVKLLKADQDESEALFREFLISVTSFFRDSEVFEALKHQIIPKLFENHCPDDPVRIWLAGCATGEEAYSLAMLIQEYAAEHEKELKVQLFATDIDDEAIDVARTGRYPDSISADVSSERLRHFFSKDNGTYTVKTSLREMIVFAQHNLIKDPHFSRLDLLICRNLLIYLNPEMQKRILPLFAQSLKPNGYLLLGTSETIGGFSDLFLVLDKKKKIFQRRESIQRIVAELPVAPLLVPLHEKEPIMIHREPVVSPGLLAEKLLMQRYSPPCVVINDKYEIVYFSNRTSRYLEPPVGEPTQNILKMAREELRPALCAAVHKTMSTQEITVYRGLKCGCGAEEEILDLRVEPVTTPPSAKGLALVIFESTGLPSSRSPENADGIPPDSAEEAYKDMIIKQLEEQLRITNEQLSSTYERMEASNEELKSSNEELMSMNEEFQSTNEELETSKEELQALNEELVTVNSELQNKVDELGQANSDLQNFLAGTNIATVFLDRQFQVKRFSPTMAKLFNLIPSDIGRPLSHLSSTINYPEQLEDVKKVLECLTPVEREIVDQENSRCFLVRLLPYRTTEDVIDGVVISFIDISDLKKNETQILKNEELLRLAADGANMGTWHWDLADNRLTWTEHCSNHYGLSHSLQPTPEIFYEAIHPDDRDMVKGAIRQALEKCEEYSAEYRIVTPDGTERWLEALGRPYCSDDGTVSGMRGITLDITRRKKQMAELDRYRAQLEVLVAERTSQLEEAKNAAEDALARQLASDERFRAVFFQSPLGIAIVSTRNGRFNEVNPRFTEIAGRSQEELLTLDWMSITHPDELQMNLEGMERIKSGTSNVLKLNKRYLRPNGSFVWVGLTAVPLFDKNGEAPLYLSIIDDITDRLRHEAELHKARVAAEAASRAKSEFLANMSHELRTPMNGVVGMAQLLKMTELTSEQHEYVTAMMLSSENLVQVIGDILDLTKIESGKMELEFSDFSLRKTIENVIQMQQSHVAAKGLSLDHTLSADLPDVISGDQQKIKQILLNLLNNAVKFTEKGSIRVTAHLLEKRGQQGVIRFTVSDTGIGMSEETILKIFNPFEQADTSTTRRFGGSGLGLTICKRFAEMMGGAIHVESLLDKGSSFHFDLPFTKGSALAYQEEPETVSTASSERSLTILLAEDNLMSRYLMEMLLEKLGHTTVCTANGRDALEHWRKGGIDLILMDIHMPGMNGIETTNAIRREETPVGGHTPIVALTADALLGTKESLLKSGFDGYLIKPLMVDDLTAVLEKLTNQEDS